MKNDNCDGSGPCQPGEVRVLPLGSNPHHGNLILCYLCFLREMAFRAERNEKLSKDCAFDLPQWINLKVYGDAREQPTRYQHRRGRRLGAV
jgi:hypothetical protein